ncbi:MAG TPA: tyrosine-type recombinase/integrase [Syntrophobacteria bacterium]|nr:tyrosine-type recombinase/integrase [Syntrophobacteria bacterium]
MAYLTKTEDDRYNLVRYRVRYRIYFPDGSWVARSRRYETLAVGRVKVELASALESRTRQLQQSPEDIKIWKNEGLLTAQEAERLDLVPAPQRKTLEQAMDEYRATWVVSPQEASIREGRVRIITQILGAKTPIVEFNYGHGEFLKTKLRERKVKVVTIRRYLQDLRRCFRHQVRLQVLPYNPFAELSTGRVPPAERPKQTRLTNAQVIEVLTKAGDRIQKESGARVLHGWLLVFLLLVFGTGLRRKEAMLARWEHVDWVNRFLVVPAENAKDGEERRVGLGRRLFNELLARREEEGLILPRYHPATITGAVTKHFAACGLPMRLHDTRHTYATLLQEDAGARPDQAMQRTGHGDLAMLTRYTHPQVDEVLEDRLGFMQEDEKETRH